MTDLEKRIQYAAKLELLLMLQNEANQTNDKTVIDFTLKFVEENK